MSPGASRSKLASHFSAHALGRRALEAERGRRARSDEVEVPPHVVVEHRVLPLVM